MSISSKSSRGLLEAMNPKPKIILELGPYVGSSAVVLGAMLKGFHDRGLDRCKVYSCELSADSTKIVRDFVKIAGLDSVVEVCEGPAAETLKRLHTEGTVTHTDVLLIDHWEKFYLPDLQVCEDLGILKKGSVVIEDNTDYPSAPDYVEYMRSGGRAGR
jgi:catechol O-methyltransferase